MHFELTVLAVMRCSPSFYFIETSVLGDAFVVDVDSLTAIIPFVDSFALSAKFLCPHRQSSLFEPLACILADINIHVYCLHARLEQIWKQTQDAQIA